MERCLTCVDEMGRLSLKRRLLMYFMLPWSALSYLCRRDGALVLEEALVDVLHAAVKRTPCSQA